MSTMALLRPEAIEVNRSTLRQRQREWLQRARGKTVLLVTAERQGEEDKYVLDKRYFQELLTRLESTIETMEIMADRRLFAQILTSAGALEEDLRLGKLHSFKEAFAGE